MLAFYVPMSYYVDSFMFRRKMRQIAQQKQAAKEARGGGGGGGDA